MILSRNKSTGFVFSSHLIYTHLIYTHLISSHLINTHLTYTHLISSHLFSYILIYFHLLSSPLFCSPLIYSNLIRSHFLSSMLLCISPAVIIKVSAFIPSMKDFIWEINTFWIIWVTFSRKNYNKNLACSSNKRIIEKKCSRVNMMIDVNTTIDGRNSHLILRKMRMSWEK